MQEERILPYRTSLPFSTLTVLSHFEMLSRLENLISVGSTIESTSLIFGYGLDLFYRRITPSNPFDVISDDFDFLILFGMLFGVVAAIYGAKYFGDRKKLGAEWA